MTTALETLKANMWKAAHDKVSAEIGGGVFSPEELHEAYLQILALETSNFNIRTYLTEMRMLQGSLEDHIKVTDHGNRLMKAAVKRVLASRYSVLSPDDRAALNAAYRHVSGT